MKINIKTYFFLFSIFTLVTMLSFSCSSRDDDPEPTPNLIGEWSGAYSGADHGTWKATLDKDGKFTGETHSDVFDNNPAMSGTVDEAGNITAITTLGIHFTGKMNLDKTASGTWVFGESTGEWKGTKK